MIQKYIFNTMTDSPPTLRPATSAGESAETWKKPKKDYSAESRANLKLGQTCS